MLSYKEVFQLAQDKGAEVVFSFPVTDYLNDLFTENEKAVVNLTLIQKWLRDTHKLDISINPHYYVNGGVAGYLADISSEENARGSSLNKRQASTEGKTYEGALLSGIHEALQLI